MIFLGPALEPSLPRAERRKVGAYYTPPEVVRRMADLALEPLLADGKQDPPNVLDPACGAGEFLVEAFSRLATRFNRDSAAAAVCGVDIDAAAVKAARRRLRELGMPAASARRGIRHADALDEQTLEPASFDCILANPPYLSIRQLAKSLPRERIEALVRRFRTARGNFDLYVLFLERAIELLRPGGRCAIIVPNKWATLDYARACRELLLERTTLEQIIDLSACRVFCKASVYPHVLVFRNQRPAASHTARCSVGLGLVGPAGPAGLLPETANTRQPQRNDKSRRAGGTYVAQRSLSAAAISLARPLDVESRVATIPLGELCKLSCGTAGFSAHRIAPRLLDVQDAWQANAPELADFITSGNIDRYCITLGNVRYLKRTYARPRLPLGAPELTPARRRLFREPKVLIAGMSRRLEVAWDDRGLALGVQVFAASEIQVDPFYLLALVNSKLLSFLFHTRFASKRLAGGYLAINKGQLARLPIVVGTLRVPSGKVAGTLRVPSNGTRSVPTTYTHLAQLGRQMSQHPRPAIDDQIDRLVYRLYRLSAGEIARVEAEFAELIRPAA